MMPELRIDRVVVRAEGLSAKAAAEVGRRVAADLAGTPVTTQDRITVRLAGVISDGR
jgi:hypothetical protein